MENEIPIIKFNLKELILQCTPHNPTTVVGINDMIREINRFNAKYGKPCRPEYIPNANTIIDKVVLKCDKYNKTYPFDKIEKVFFELVEEGAIKEVKTKKFPFRYLYYTTAS